MGGWRGGLAAKVDMLYPGKFSEFHEEIITFFR